MAKFEVKARVIDLLGTQQIANCPTAISELFKNAYDAYAREAMLDIDIENDCAYLWDNGIGMTEDELLHRWLVVGAAGKDRLKASIEPPKGMKIRPIQGEKGIGRLAISTLGDTLLLISRSSRAPASADPYVALLINWNLIRNELLPLSAIDVPTVTFGSISDLASGIVADMAKALRATVTNNPKAWSGSNSSLQETILRQLDNLHIDAKALSHLAKEITPSGTIFYITNIIPELYYYTRSAERHEPQSPVLVQLLSNFHKSFERVDDDGLDSLESNEFKADVRQLDPETGRWRSFFADHAAIQPEDLRNYDHYLDIYFDAEGRYKGTLRIYDKDVALPPVDLQPRQQLQCGPFHLRLWYFQGNQAESTLTADEWTLIDQKLQHFGGLMIYRDDLRVLPYGSPEFDWLRFEERRSKGAGRYFFSYRRMFGYVDIQRSANPSLVDKAGREGLIHNSAYRDLQRTLQGFFSDVALKHFMKGEHYEAAKRELKERAQILKEERRRIQRRRDELQEELVQRLDFIKRSADGRLEALLAETIGELQRLAKPEPPEIAATTLRFQERLAQIEGKSRYSIPANLSLGRDRRLKTLVAEYRNAAGTFSLACQEIRRRFNEQVRTSWPDAEGLVDRQRIIENAYKQALAKIGVAFKIVQDVHSTEQGKIAKHLEFVKDASRLAVDNILMELTATTTLEDAKRSEHGNLPDLLSGLSRASDEAIATLNTLKEELATHLSGFVSGESATIRKYQHEEIEELREQVDRNLELVQLGLSVEIIDHDLNRLYRGIQGILANLKNIARTSPNATRLVEELRGSFQHLEDRYRQMSPLYRGSYRSKARIEGVKILTYCRGFLDQSLRSVDVQLKISDSFRALVIEEVPAVILPVFVNLIDNSIYWLRDREERVIMLDRVGDVVTVCDTGPGIDPSLLEEIFEPFVSTKPGGRGLGLYIARANLVRYHHEIWATDDPAYRRLTGACFCIRFHEDTILQGA